MLAVTFAITSSLLIEAHIAIGGDRTVAMISQIKEAVAEYSEEFTMDDDSDNGNEQRNEGDLDYEITQENPSVGGLDGIVKDGDVRHPVFPFWTKYHLIFASVSVRNEIIVTRTSLMTVSFCSSWASYAVLNAFCIC